MEYSARARNPARDGPLSPFSAPPSWLAEEFACRQGEAFRTCPTLRWASLTPLPSPPPAPPSHTSSRIFSCHVNGFFPGFPAAARQSSVPDLPNLLCLSHRQGDGGLGGCVLHAAPVDASLTQDRTHQTRLFRGVVAGRRSISELLFWEGLNRKGSLRRLWLAGWMAARR